jgi:hypothetical protein
VTALAQAAHRAPLTRLREVVPANRAEAARLRSEREARAQQFRATSRAAREFYTTHAAHPRATEARKLEALAALEGITPKDKSYERTAFATATAFRTSTSHPVADRIQVAHAMESVAITRRTLGRPWFANPLLAETMLDRLRAEFGERPEIWGQFLALAENTYCDAGRDVAHRIVQSSDAPEPTKVAARQILERYQLVRQPLELPLTLAGGRATTLGQLAGRTTVLCLWDGNRHPEGPPGLREFRERPPANTSWVFVSIGALGPARPGKGPGAVPHGTTCVEALGWNSPIVARLRVRQLPYVFVLDEAKQLSGYGRIHEIPALLAGIGRPALP